MFDNVPFFFIRVLFVLMSFGTQSPQWTSYYFSQAYLNTIVALQQLQRHKEAILISDFVLRKFTDDNALSRARTMKSWSLESIAVQNFHEEKFAMLNDIMFNSN